MVSENDGHRRLSEMIPVDGSVLLHELVGQPSVIAFFPPHLGSVHQRSDGPVVRLVQQVEPSVMIFLISRSVSYNIRRYNIGII